MVVWECHLTYNHIFTSLPKQLSPFSSGKVMNNRWRVISIPLQWIQISKSLQGCSVQLQLSLCREAFLCRAAGCPGAPHWLLCNRYIHLIPPQFTTNTNLLLQLDKFRPVFFILMLQWLHCIKPPLMSERSLRAWKEQNEQMKKHATFLPSELGESHAARSGSGETVSEEGEERRYITACVLRPSPPGLTRGIPLRTLKCSPRGSARRSAAMTARQEWECVFLFSAAGARASLLLLPSLLTFQQCGSLITPRIHSPASWWDRDNTAVQTSRTVTPASASVLVSLTHTHTESHTRTRSSAFTLLTFELFTCCWKTQTCNFFFQLQWRKFLLLFVGLHEILFILDSFSFRSWKCFSSLFSFFFFGNSRATSKSRCPQPVAAA